MWAMRQLADELNHERLSRAEQQRPGRRCRATRYREARARLMRNLTGKATTLLRPSAQTDS
jgi:hypothetical protein